MSTSLQYAAQPVSADLANQDNHGGNVDQVLQKRFSKVFERIAAGAVEREQNRELAYEAVQWLREAGFTGLRVPKQYGGEGITLPQFFRLLIKLGEADSNLPQILRLKFRLYRNAARERRRSVARTLAPACSSRCAVRRGDFRAHRFDPQFGDSHARSRS